MVRGKDLDGAFMLADRLYPTLISNDSRQEDLLFLNKPARLGVGVLSTPSMMPLRRDPRFLAIAERVGLWRYWRQSHLPDFCADRPEPVCATITRGK